jgi:CheY-like chemotaxis protein
MIFRILIVDDEPNIRSGLMKGLVGEADEVVAAQDGTEALTLSPRPSRPVITDLKMPDRSRPGSRGRLHDRRNAHARVTAQLIETAVEAMRNGSDYIRSGRSEYAPFWCVMPASTTLVQRRGSDRLAAAASFRDGRSLAQYAGSSTRQVADLM